MHQEKYGIIWIQGTSPRQRQSGDARDERIYSESHAKTLETPKPCKKRPGNPETATADLRIRGAFITLITTLTILRIVIVVLGVGTGNGRQVVLLRLAGVVQEARKLTW
jgi:hypothetical protein